jgi:hypothetical protein
LPRDSGRDLIALGAFATAGAVFAAISTARPERVGRHAALLGPTGSAEFERVELRSTLLARPARLELIALATANFFPSGPS